MSIIQNESAQTAARRPRTRAALIERRVARRDAGRPRAVIKGERKGKRKKKKGKKRHDVEAMLRDLRAEITEVAPRSSSIGDLGFMTRDLDPRAAA